MRIILIPKPALDYALGRKSLFKPVATSPVNRNFLISDKGSWFAVYCQIAVEIALFIMPVCLTKALTPRPWQRDCPGRKSSRSNLPGITSHA